ncbi:RTTN-like protein [Mya arenaria]|uniref:RTTN-like protein n=1 Tax=Mya arenaria TaxID=6604 RepID=A0ABY7ESA8_MYAAR|nr:RTTN-like protein [Mya arenaria]
MVLTQKFNDLTRMDGLQKVYKIFTSLLVDPGVKKSAGSTRHYTASRSQHYEDHKARYKKLLLQLLAHPIGKLRLGVFTAVLQCVKTNLSVLKASEPGSTSCEKVANDASELVTHLLKRQLLMSPALWQFMLRELARALPILQSYASVNTVLGTSILAMLETKPSTSTSEITQGEKVQTALYAVYRPKVKQQRHFFDADADADDEDDDDDDDDDDDNYYYFGRR